MRVRIPEIIASGRFLIEQRARRNGARAPRGSRAAQRAKIISQGVGRTAARRL
jgi:hypothetical protein